MEDNYSNVKFVLLCLLISVSCLWIMVTTQKTDLMLLRSAFLHFVNCPNCKNKKKDISDKQENKVNE